jgi:hypothetical protein
LLHAVAANEAATPNRMITAHDADEAPPCLVSGLPDHVLAKCFSFLGPGHYRFVGGTCHWFRDVYRATHGRDETTFWENVASSSCAKQVFEDLALLGIPQDEVARAWAQISSNAIMMGRIDVLQWGVDNGHAFDPLIFTFVGQSGHVNVLQWAQISIIERSEEYMGLVAAEAARHGKIQLLDFIFSTQPDVACGIEEYAVEGGQVRVLDWLKHHQLMDYRHLNDMYNTASFYGHVHVLDWLLAKMEYEHCMDEVALRGAASGDVSILQWAHAHGARWSCKLCAMAAFYNNLDALRWLRKHECPWDGNVLFHGEGHFRAALLDWARENGCPEEAEIIFDDVEFDLCDDGF